MLRQRKFAHIIIQHLTRDDDRMQDFDHMDTSGCEAWGGGS